VANGSQKAKGLFLLLPFFIFYSIIDEFIEINKVF